MMLLILGKHIPEAVVTVRLFLTVLLLIISGLPVLACPVCDTGTGKAVRAGLFDGGDFGVNLLAVLLPFPVFIGIAAVVYYGVPSMPRPRKTARSDQEQEATDHDRP